VLIEVIVDVVIDFLELFTSDLGQIDVSSGIAIRAVFVSE
jgi:hypothetical protein